MDPELYVRPETMKLLGESTRIKLLAMGLDNDFWKHTPKQKQQINIIEYSVLLITLTCIYFITVLCNGYFIFGFI